MNRIDRALKRRDAERGRIPAHGSGVGSLPQPSQSEEPQSIPAELLDRFHSEALGPDLMRQPSAPGTVASDRFVGALSPSASELPTTTGAFRDFNLAIRGMVVGDPTMNRQSAEQYRRLAASLYQVQVERGIKKVMVASAVAGEGKTLTALNLALTLSESYRRRVVLIDADLRGSGFQAVLDNPNVSGLNDALKAMPPKTPTLMTVSPMLSVLPAGYTDPEPMEQLTSERMASILDELSAKFDWVIVDTPPVVVFPDTNLLARMVDAAVLVVLAGQTSYDLVARAIQALGRERILGIILNRVDATEGSHASDYGEKYRRSSPE